MLILAVALAVTVWILGFAVLGPRDHGANSKQCFWAVTVQTDFQGYAKAPCDSPVPPSLKNAKFFCPFVKEGKYVAAPHNHLANCL